MRKLTLLILLISVLASGAFWFAFNRPVKGLPAVGELNGVSFSPYRGDEDPTKGRHPTRKEIDEDLATVADVVSSVRTYSVTDGMEQIPELARKQDLDVLMGAWIGSDLQRNAIEMKTAIKLARKYSNVEGVLVGNEAVLREEVTPQQLAQYLRYVRQRVRQPVSSAEPWHIWLKYPELAREADFIAIHVLPYWEGIDVHDAIPFLLDRYAAVKKAYPNKRVVLTEVGWPSEGRTIKAAQPSRVNEATFLREFVQAAHKNKIDYYVMEAFDQPWKSTLEGTVGAYWGLFDAARNPKFPMEGAVQEVPNWPYLWMIASLLALIPLLWLFSKQQQNIRTTGLLFLATMFQVIASLAVWITQAAAARYLSTAGVVSWIAVAIALTIVIAIVISEGIEVAETLWKKRFERRFIPLDPNTAQFTPLVSLQVPTYNEPPAMVIETLQALSKLEYPNFEVVVLDNNTRDPALWTPVESYCQTLGQRFRFVHADNVNGFKAGALNLALGISHPEAEIIAVIDSDYAVEPGWLGRLVPYFKDPAVALVQAPQDYRDAADNAFKEMCYWEYAGFFHIGMVQRNERNAIIQHGTMTMIRRKALEDVGRWAEWCICEDAELGLRLFRAGYQSIYVPHSMGRGLTPDSFTAYKSQRFRWAYGAVQIIKRHFRALIGRESSVLTPGQRYHFVTGWLPWVADALHFAFTVAGILWTAALLIWPKYVEIPLQVFLVAALSFVVFRTIKPIWLYLAKVKCGFWRSIGASVAGLSLSHTVAKAVWTGFFTSDKPFLRTPKCENSPAVVKALTMAWEEGLLLLALFGLAGGCVVQFGTEDREAVAWAAMLCAQSLPYLAAVVMAWINALPALGSRLLGTGGGRGRASGLFSVASTN